MSFFKSGVSELTCSLNLKHSSVWQCSFFICKSRSFHQELKYFLNGIITLAVVFSHSSSPGSVDFGAREDKGGQTTSENVSKMLDEERNSIG